MMNEIHYFIYQLIGLKSEAGSINFGLQASDFIVKIFLEAESKMH